MKKELCTNYLVRQPVYTDSVLRYLSVHDILHNGFFARISISLRKPFMIFFDFYSPPGPSRRSESSDENVLQQFLVLSETLVELQERVTSSEFVVLLGVALEFDVCVLVIFVLELLILFFIETSFLKCTMIICYNESICRLYKQYTGKKTPNRSSD